tara:strand:- start:67 stop:456 length:390 start_codon:yes stop_codon:yes gene_type:complete
MQKNKEKEKAKALVSFGLVIAVVYFFCYIFYWMFKTFTRVMTILFSIFKVKFPFAINKYLQLFLFLISFGSFAFLTNNNNYLVEKFNIDESILIILFLTFFLSFYSLLEIALRSEYATNLFNSNRKWCD